MADHTETHQFNTDLTLHDSSQTPVTVRAIAQIEESAVRSPIL
ncbi:hypothetical protein [Nostoc sp. UHCC 0252]|nr:hypothetical protein [Nostoc sp. UHCC 0252]MEA5602724.1 hypothetical protein [Nostoc sp. UHCC 0252]